MIDVKTLERANDLFDELHGVVEFSITGEFDNKNMGILRTHICGKITSLCQKCLNEVVMPIDTTTIVRLFDNEDSLTEALTDNDDFDGIVHDTHFNVLDFAEDEIIMLLPIAPKHSNCT